ncbi:MAG: fatty acid desaturase [Methylococcaceae bacterium]|nr:fatty acid desaturase [Methylococcaceae bacterium]MCI0667115.1 fatty acid desaturase [Methylococcaceae bacterium]
MRNAFAEPLRIRIFSSYLLSLLIPGYSFLFVVTGPHSLSATVLWILPMWSTVLIDMWSPSSRKQPGKNLHPLPYDGILYLLGALQFIAILALLDFSTRLNFTSPVEWATSLVNLFAIKVIVGTSSSFSGIVVAHELIHRADRFNRTLGRLLLALEGYEHFATEHIRGHHKNFGTPADPATARAGESYAEFWKRTVPAQFKNAWKLENQRLGIQDWIRLDSRFCSHRVAQGVLFESIMLIGIGLVFGIEGLLVFAVQAFAAVRKLEAVNYIEHWGLCRAAERPGKPLSWDTDSWFTLNAMVGLSRHSDHHRHVAKPYHQLCFSVESPKLPYGYFATVFLAVSLNRRFQKLVQQELARLGLTPGQRIPADPPLSGRIPALPGLSSMPPD